MAQDSLAWRSFRFGLSFCFRCFVPQTYLNKNLSLVKSRPYEGAPEANMTSQVQLQSLGKEKESIPL